MISNLEPQVTLPWLVKLRWLAVLCQVAALAVARWGLELPVAWEPFAWIAGVTAASNALLFWSVRRALLERASATLMGGALCLDTLLLTGLLAASGGSMNPFTVLYLVHITLSAVVLSARWTTLVTLLAVLGYGSLFLTPVDAHAFHHGDGPLGAHLHGMWIAFVLAAGLTAFFVLRITAAVRRQHEQLARLRESSARNARLASLTTLAAGAAHELGTPLGTIAVAAHEALLAAERRPDAADLAEDLRLILLEVERCQHVLGRMAARASGSNDGGRTVRADELASRVQQALGAARARHVELRFADRLELDAPAAELTQTITALVQNGLDACPGDASVTVELSSSATGVEVSVEDRGSGIPDALLQRVGEPFFTTKQPGRGLGLGVFLARAFAESRGGVLLIESREGSGTRATLRLPSSSPATAEAS